MARPLLAVSAAVSPPDAVRSSRRRSVHIVEVGLNVMLPFLVLLFYFLQHREMARCNKVFRDIGSEVEMEPGANFADAAFRISA